MTELSEAATGRIHGFRREHLAACALAAELERRSVVTTKKHERVEGMVAEHARAYAALGLTAAQTSSRLRGDMPAF